MYQDFQATVLLPSGDGAVEVTAFNDGMSLLSEIGPVLISKAQAMKFFNLVEVPVNDHRAWYDEAMVASNTAGYVGLSAAQTIEAQSSEIEQLRTNKPGCGEAGHADGRCGNSQCLFDEPR